MAVNQLALAPPGPSFYHRVAAAPLRVLMLDYDGTLAPFHVERDLAVPYPGVWERVQALVTGGRSRVVVVTGRALGEVDALLGVEPPPEVWASHGWEHRASDSEVRRFPLPKAAARGLDLARGSMREQGLEEASESKPGSIGLHWRGEPAEIAVARERAARKAWSPIAEGHGLELRPFDGGIELRAPGRDKGAAVRDVLSGAPPGTVAAYLGDDLTDEDAFRALPEGALGVLVREELRPTDAGAWVRPPEGLLDFLDRWLAAEAGAAPMNAKGAAG